MLGLRARPEPSVRYWVVVAVIAGVVASAFLVIAVLRTRSAEQLRAQGMPFEVFVTNLIAGLFATLVHRYPNEIWQPFRWASGG